MKKYKHKKTGCIATECSGNRYFLGSSIETTLPKSIIENTNDWELIRPIVTNADLTKSIFSFNDIIEISEPFDHFRTFRKNDLMTLLIKKL